MGRHTWHPTWCVLSSVSHVVSVASVSVLIRSISNFYMVARGTHPDAWGFPAPSERAADRLFLDNVGSVMFLPY